MVSAIPVELLLGNTDYRSGILTADKVNSRRLGELATEGRRPIPTSNASISVKAGQDGQRSAAAGREVDTKWRGDNMEKVARQ